MKSLGVAALLVFVAPAFACGSADEGAAPPKTPVVASVSASTSASALSSAPVAIVAPHAPKAPVGLAEYFTIKHVHGLSFSFDDKLVAYMRDEGGRQDVWVRPLAGGAATQITPDVFAAEVDYFGPSDRKSVSESFPAYWAAGSSSIYKKLGDPREPADGA